MTKDPLAAYNYCVSFIDLLGQRAALKGEGLLPTISTPEDKKRFEKILKESVGAIAKLQKSAEDMLGEALAERPESPLRRKLTPDEQRVWDEMRTTKVETQRWSDGLVSYVNLGDPSVKCHLNGVFNLFGLAGGLCYFGLASNRPIRGAIETAWGMELRPGELYGAVIARAYELESEVAQYPRIIVGPGTIQFLVTHKNNDAKDVYSQNNRALAQVCLEMLSQDTDGNWIVHYLGKGFREAITQEHHLALFEAAEKNVVGQYELHKASGNSKLAFRYAHLRSYFSAHSKNAT